MKSTLALHISAAACCAALLAGCGQPGPLYLPKQPAKPASPAATQGKPGVAPPSAPVPSTPPASQQ
ncbi:LPS translocon maturation chaperone LptM [Pseudoduganella namucuonensis]|uniref:LPS translocon maturation chaperone LptM n=1 Tax=Pseudoduganella namucuonensis TaxID=1035707 RepID=UPI00353057B7